MDKVWTARVAGGCVLAAIVAAELTCAAGADLSIVKIEPTPLFPKVAASQPLRQIARLHLSNPGPAAEARVKIGVAGGAAITEELGTIVPGASVKDIHVPDVARPAELIIELYPGADQKPASVRKLTWQPQRKWRIFCVSYSHHDLGFGDYPHRLRTTIRHANIERPLQFCKQTDAWDEDSKFRFMIETSEPITSFLGTHSEAEAAEFARRVREGRIQIGAVHNTANTEQLSHECLARLFYLTNRHGRDLLDIPASKTAQIDDVIGLTWPLATFCAEAGVPYFFHGPNGCGRCLQPAELEPVFFWQAPDRHSRVLMRSAFYGGYAGDSPGDGSETHILGCIRKLGANWPYDALLLQEGTDFQLVSLDTARKIHAWNAKWAYPQMVCATMDMFFDAIAKQAAPEKIKSFAKDGNNQWADQDANDAWLLGHARRQGEAIPTAEKFATVAQALSGGGYPWTDIYQAYHRLLAYHEHTNAIDVIGPDLERMRQYETELEENREMVAESAEFSRRALDGALERLSQDITTEAERSILVFNPLTHARTDVVRIDGKDLPNGSRLVDPASGKEAPHQQLPDGGVVFIAPDVPSLGYKVFSVLPGAAGAAAQPSDRAGHDGRVLENGSYCIRFDPATGAIVSIRDKQLGVELVDPSAPHKFNEYLYERFETPDITTPSKWHRVQSAKLETTRGPVAAVMTIQATAVGADDLRQTVVLYHGPKRIDFRLELVKSPSGRNDRMPNSSALNKESLFVAMPFAVPAFQFRHELPGCVAEPVKDLFGGACTAFYAVRHFSDVSNSRFGVTVSPIDSSLVEYDHPRSCPLLGGREGEFERLMEYPKTSRMYLYLLNNMFDVNVRWDQRGPMSFGYSLRSHAGGWKEGRADQFGAEVHNPLIARVAVGKKRGRLPPAGSFASIDQPNVVCTTIKPAEANGAGIILRFVETQGRETATNVTLPFLERITAALETNLVEEDLPRIAVSGGNTIAFAIRPFGVKTLRVISKPAEPLPAVAGLKAVAASDMQVDLEWPIRPDATSRITHYHVYRGTAVEFKPGLLHLVARPPQGPSSICRHRDQPQLHYGGWINNRLEPATTYYYRVAAVDRWNNEGPVSPPVAVTTLKSSEKNMPPLRVECLRAVAVSPLSRFNVVNLLWRTNCECDVRKYEIHRSTEAGFSPNGSTRIGMADADALLAGSEIYGHAPIDHRLGAFDHMMFLDEGVKPDTTYYYRVCAVDAAGQKGPYSGEAAARTKEPAPFVGRATAQSVYAPQYGPDNAIDGDPDPYRAWISAQYGGGTRADIRDTWLVVELPRRVKIKGVKIIGDEREVIPYQRNLQVQVRQGKDWKTAGEVRDAKMKTVRATWTEPLETDAVRVSVPAKDYPRASRADVGGIVRVCELLLVLPDGTETTLQDLFGKKPPVR
jgi:hypothetical protein